MSDTSCKRLCTESCNKPKYLPFYTWPGEDPNWKDTSRKSKVTSNVSDPPDDFEDPIPAPAPAPAPGTAPTPSPAPAPADPIETPAPVTGGSGYVQYGQLTPGTFLQETSPSLSSQPLWPINGYHGSFHLSQGTRRANFVSSSTQRHDPDGIKWISASTWNNAYWDGVPMDPCTNSASAIKAWMFPNANTMRGLRQRYYEVNPFTDLRNPTIAEIDSWNIEIIRHFRRLLGLNNPITPLRSLYKRAQWTNEAGNGKRFIDGVATCISSSNQHCGATYIPSCGEFDNDDPNVPGQNSSAYRYTDETDSWTCITSVPSGSEGVNTINSDLAWSIKLTRVIVQFLASDGLGSHTGPFLVREYVGMAFYYYSDGATIFRGKWAGNLGPRCP